MPAPPRPAPPKEIDLSSDDLVADPEERTTSQTRRLGTNASAAAELDVRKGPGAARRPSNPPEVVPIDETPVKDAGAKPAGKPYLAGDVIDGKYRLTRIIGKGGMGAVWQAHNIPLDIDVAIKLIRRDRTAPGAGERLLTEARAAARLMHPAIVRVFDFGESEQGDPFIVMELLHGESLNAILRRKKRLTPAVAVQTLLPVAAALASAHGKGIVHRDLKPDNIILVTDEGGALVPKIVDFGIAKLLSPGVDRHVTMAGEVLGSPDYMSPEQARGAENVGEASDIWTFSVVLYELVTGRRPFDGVNYNALIASIITDEPQPITAHGVGDAALAGILAHGLTKDIVSRWPRIRDMGAALASWAVANGIEDDVMGNPIAKQWLSGAARRLLTVQPETGEAPMRSTPAEPPAPQAPPAPPTPQLVVLGPQASPPPQPPVAGPVPQPPVVEPPARPRRQRSATLVEDVRVAASIDQRRATARQALFLTIAIVVLGAAAVVVFLLRDRARQGSAVPTATEAASADSAPLPSATGSASDDPGASGHAAPGASAEPSGSGAASGHTPVRYPRRPRAPAAPKNIKF